MQYPLLDAFLTMLWFFLWVLWIFLSSGLSLTFSAAKT